MPIKKVTIESILDGKASTQYLSKPHAYNAAIGIDPDFPATSSGILTSGAIVPVAYSKFSSTGVDGWPLWIITNPKDSNVYCYQTSGKFNSYSSALTTASETAIGTPTSGAGNGAVYYNNYIYLMTPTDVSRYGPLNGSPSIANTFWSSTLGLTTLTNTTYPEIRSVKIPNHAGFVHSDNCLYFGDVVNGQGVIHKIKTKKVTVEGDTNDGSEFNVLDLPFGYYPVDITNWGLDLAIACITTSNATINQGSSAIILWDPTNTTTFYNIIPISDPLITAIQNINGDLIIWSGNASNGVRVSRYIGGNSVKTIAYLEEGAPPFAGATDFMDDKIMFGGYVTYPSAAGVVYSLGSKRFDLPAALNVPIKTTSAGATPMVTAVKFVEQSSNVKPKVIAGWGDASAKGIDKQDDAGTLAATFRDKNYLIGKRFKINKISIPLTKAVAANMSLVTKVYTDEESTTVTLPTINATNFPNSERRIEFRATDLAGAIGENNFFIEFNWTGTVSLPISYPVYITIDIDDND